VNNSGRALTYAMTGSSSLPQGLELNDDGLIIGRAAFEFFTLDKGTTTIDGVTSMFDNTYSFQVTATTTDQTSSSSQTFSILVNNFNITPYEDVYVRALSTLDQRELFLSIVNNTDIFPTELLYRSSDPNFGVAKDIRSLFLAGLKPNEISTYLSAMNTNTYKKRIDFGDIKTAIAVDENFNVKYEVVYIQLENDFTYDITASTSVYDKVIGKSVYNNSYANMSEVLSSNLGYANIGALPDWMTSPQSNKKVLGFTRAIVLAYTVPGASKLMAYRLGANGISFNEINFVVDRYDLDNSYTANYNIETETYETGHETTFDRIERSYTVVGSADYSINGIAFNQINNQTVTFVNSLGGLDGKTDYVDGETLIFTQQENFPASVGLYNGWINNGVIVPGFVEFENSQKYPIGTPGLPSSPQVGQVADVDGVFYMFTADRDAAGNVLDTVWKVANLRASVWTINIDSNNIITLTPATFQRTVGVGSSAVKVPSTTMTGDFIQINYGVQHSESLVFYNPVISIGISVPAFDFIITRLNPSTSVTRFDGYGTKFLEYKTIYETPETNDSWLIFPTNGPLL
jgi:hypothetical protein